MVLIICSYMDQEFVRVGYYVNSEYDDDSLKENPPELVAYDRLVRNVLADKPRVTRIPIRWDTIDEIGPMPESADVYDGFPDESEESGFPLPNSLHQSNYTMEVESNSM